LRILTQVVGDGTNQGIDASVEIDDSMHQIVGSSEGWHRTSLKRGSNDASSRRLEFSGRGQDLGPSLVAEIVLGDDGI